MQHPPRGGRVGGLFGRRRDRRGERGKTTQEDEERTRDQRGTREGAVACGDEPNAELGTRKDPTRDKERGRGCRCFSWRCSSYEGRGRTSNEEQGRRATNEREGRGSNRHEGRGPRNTRDEDQGTRGTRNPRDNGSPRTWNRATSNTRNKQPPVPGSSYFLVPRQRETYATRNNGATSLVSGPSSDPSAFRVPCCARRPGRRCAPSSRGIATRMDRPPSGL